MPHTRAHSLSQSPHTRAVRWLLRALVWLGRHRAYILIHATELFTEKILDGSNRITPVLGVATMSWLLTNSNSTNSPTREVSSGDIPQRGPVNSIALLAWPYMRSACMWLMHFTIACRCLGWTAPFSARGAIKILGKASSRRLLMSRYMGTNTECKCTCQTF